MSKTAKQKENRGRFAWFAFTGAVVVWAAMPFILTADVDPSIYALAVPPALLLLGGFLAGGNRHFAWACITFGLVMDAMLAAYALSTVDVQVSGPASLWRHTPALQIAAIPAAPFAGAIPAYQAIRGRLKPAVGMVGAAVSVAGLLMGLYLLKELGAFA